MSSGRVLASDKRAAAEKDDAAHQEGERDQLSGQGDRFEDQPLPEEHNAEQAGDEGIDDGQTRLRARRETPPGRRGRRGTWKLRPPAAGRMGTSSKRPQRAPAQSAC